MDDGQVYELYADANGAGPTGKGWLDAKIPDYLAKFALDQYIRLVDKSGICQEAHLGYVGAWDKIFPLLFAKFVRG